MARAGWPDPADFAAPPTAAQRLAWNDADRAARPDRLARLRARFEASDVDAYFGVRRENTRYLTGFELGDGEEKVAGDSGQFLVAGDEAVVLADSRYPLQAGEEAPEPAGRGLPRPARALAGPASASVGAPARRRRGRLRDATRCGSGSRPRRRT